MTRTRFGLLALSAGLLVGARSRRSRPAPAASVDHNDLLVVERGARRFAGRLHAEIAAVEDRGRRRAAMTVALTLVAVLPALAVAVRPDLDPLVGAVLVGAYAVLAVAALLLGARPSRRRDRRTR